MVFFMGSLTVVLFFGTGNDFDVYTRSLLECWFDALIAALPLEGGEEAQVKRIAELQAENEVVGLELQKQLEAAGTETGSGFVLSSFRQLFESEESRLIFSTVSKYLTPLVQSLIIHVSLLI
ncbi:uncharacterized protein LOC110018171 isoform X3 [Phalaenopsis equestris]|uniref:uncharacterized protein LOC110018171 isoform X3 n=1 Tax=Phalaenopsis equestris TaxID=78828 RepID=UPI0009E45CE9|nr:uncharacterized protein LOC110018171 isoform X3 [Phalaenopsis equestris]